MILRPASGTRRADEGFTLIEVMVAVLVLAIVSTGIVASMTTIIRMTQDNRARITAANLATQDLDLVRAIADPYQVSNSTATTYVDNTYYHLVRKVSWVSSAGADVSCNSATNLFYLRVNDRVTWDGMLSTTNPVQDDTLLAPSDSTSNGQTGAIEISVATQSGTPVAGVAVTVTPTSGGQALTTQPAATTADGCTYANQVVPGTYSVTISKVGYIGFAPNGNQSTSPSTTVQVVAGTTASAPYTYDQTATYGIDYAAGPAAYAGAVNLPSNLPTNFLSTGATVVMNAPASTKQLFPFSSGYSATTGFASNGATNCQSIDPAAWPAGTVNGVSLKAGVRAVTNPTAAPGGVGHITIPVGVVLVRAASGAVLQATQGTAVWAGNPGCGVTGSVLSWTARGNGGWVALALPYGAWSITAGGVQVSPSDLVAETNVASGGVAADGTVTLDPRKS